MSGYKKHIDAEALYGEARDYVMTQDPAPVLDSLGIEYTPLKGGTVYSFRIRPSDKTPSVRFSLMKNGTWRYVDFGEGNKSDTIIGLIMRFNGGDFKQAIIYAMRQLSAPQEMVDALENIYSAKQRGNTIGAKEKEMLEKIRKVREQAALSNIETRKKAQPTIRITNFEMREAKGSNFAEDLLRNRGIPFVPSGFMFIKGTQAWADGGTSTFYGVGVPILDRETGEPVAADIHYQRKIGKFKSLVVQNPNASLYQDKSASIEKRRWDISFIDRSPDAAILVFESKMDYAAVWSQDPHRVDQANIIITNSVSNYEKASEKIAMIVSSRSENVKKNPPAIVFFNQADPPGYGLVKNIMEQLQEKKSLGEAQSFWIVRYKIPDEYKLDPNDLHNERINISKRLEPATFEDVCRKYDWLKKHEEKLLSRGVFVIQRNQKLPTFIFENMDDYEIALSFQDFGKKVERSNVIVAAAPSQHKEVAKEIEGRGLERSKLVFVTESDLAGRRLATATVNELKGWRAAKDTFYILEYGSIATPESLNRRLYSLQDFLDRGLSPVKSFRKMTQSSLLKRMKALSIQYKERAAGGSPGADSEIKNKNAAPGTKDAREEAYRPENNNEAKIADPGEG